MFISFGKLSTTSTCELSITSTVDKFLRALKMLCQNEAAGWGNSLSNLLLEKPSQELFLLKQKMFAYKNFTDGCFLELLKRNEYKNKCANQSTVIIRLQKTHWERFRQKFLKILGSHFSVTASWDGWAVNQSGKAYKVRINWNEVSYWTRTRILIFF